MEFITFTDAKFLIVIAKGLQEIGLFIDVFTFKKWHNINSKQTIKSEGDILQFLDARPLTKDNTRGYTQNFNREIKMEYLKY